MILILFLSFYMEGKIGIMSFYHAQHMLGNSKLDLLKNFNPFGLMEWLPKFYDLIFC